MITALLLPLIVPLLKIPSPPLLFLSSSSVFFASVAFFPMLYSHFGFISLGATPLHDASRYGHLHLVEALLGAKANLNEQDKCVFSLRFFFNFYPVATNQLDVNMHPRPAVCHI